MMTVKVIYNNDHSRGYPCIRYDIYRVLDDNKNQTGWRLEIHAVDLLNRPTTDIIIMPQDTGLIYFELGGKTVNTLRWPPKSNTPIGDNHAV